MPCVLATVTVNCMLSCMRYYCIDLEYNQIILDCDIDCDIKGSGVYGERERSIARMECG